MTENFYLFLEKALHSHARFMRQVTSNKIITRNTKILLFYLYTLRDLGRYVFWTVCFLTHKCAGVDLESLCCTCAINTQLFKLSILLYCIMV